MILNYTTQISVGKTVGEIQEKLAAIGARKMMIEFGEDHTPEAVSFQIDLNGTVISYRLPSQWQGVWYALKDEPIPNKLKTPDQARRVAWRIIKDWIEAQVAIIQAGVVQLPEVFLPYAIATNGKTVYETWRDKVLLLDSGEVDPT